MKPLTQILIIVAIGAALVGLTWWQTGEMKEREFSDRLRDSPAKIDTLIVYRERPQKPTHDELGPLPARPSKEEGESADTAFTRALAVSLDSALARNRYISAPVDTTIGADSTGKARIRYNPMTRMLVCDFMRPPIREIEREILKTVYVPVIEHDSFGTRSALVGSGALVGALILSLLK
jgi:hypothetical protein